MAAKEKTSSRWAAWLAPILFLLAAVAAAGPASALTCGALETRAWEKTSSPLQSRLDESLQLLNLHQQNGGPGYDDALGSPLAAEGAGLPKTRAELDADLKSKGFVTKGTNSGGYTTYKHPDGRKVDIKPTGEVVPTSPTVSSTGKAYNQRTDYNFNRLPDQSHSTGHFVEPNGGNQ